MRRRLTGFRRLPALCVLLALSAVAGTHVSQISASPQSAPQAVFRAGVDLVTIDVTVVDKDGRPIRGLTADDFTVRLEGQLRPVRALDFLEFGSARTSTRPATVRQTSNEPGTPASRIRTIVLVFDDLSYAAGRGKPLLAAAERMLPKFADDDLIGLATTSGLGPAINPTRDRAVLMAALRDKRLIGRYDDGAGLFDITTNEAVEIERGTPALTLQQVAERECGRLRLDPDVCTPMIVSHARSFVQQSHHRSALQLASYRTVMNALRRTTPPRVMVTLSRGLALAEDSGLPSFLKTLSQTAAEARVQFYALTDAPDEVDLSTLGPPDGLVPSKPFPLLQTARRDEARFLNSGIQTVASAAGGTAFVVAGGADRFIQRIERETSGLYRLGVEAPNRADAARFAAASVAVRQPGLTVHVNRQAFVASAQPEALPVEDRVRAALAEEAMAFGVPIALATALRRDPASGELQNAANVQIPQSVPGPLVAMFGLIDATGRIIQAGRMELPAPATGGAYQLAFAVPMPPGAHRLRFVVADVQGSVGSVEHPLTRELLHLGGFSASDLLATWSGADRQPRFLALETLPDGAQSLNASLELYPDDPARVPDLAVRMELLSAQSNKPIHEREIVPEVVGTTRIASARLPVAELAAGSYLIRATILERGVATGNVSMSLRKIGAAAPPTPPPAAVTLMHFRHWLDLAREHAPGQIDEAVREVRAYSISRLEGLRGDLEALTALLRNPYESRLRRLQDYSDAERRVLQGIAFAELAAHTDNRLLRRIALLHTDAAVLPGAVAYVVEAWATSGQAVAVSQDGVPVGLARLSPHLPIARAALANISPRPADDAWVRGWYHATTAYLFKSAQIVALPDHLADRRKALPDDSGAAFAEGCLFEVYSSDEIQQAAQAERARGGKTNVPGRRDALLRARQLFGQVGPEAPEYAEARLRLARMHLRLDEARAAADEIEAWLAAGSPDRQLRYYAYLILGASQWTLANAKASAAAYGEALKLYPSAQSAVVGLLLVRPGDAIDSASATVAVLRAPASDRTDPWIEYGLGPGRHFDALISMLWQSVAGK